MSDGRFQGRLNLKCRLYVSPTQRNPRVFNAEWFAVAHIELKHNLWLKIRRYAFGMNKIIKLVGLRFMQLMREKQDQHPTIAI